MRSCAQCFLLAGHLKTSHLLVYFSREEEVAERQQHWSNLNIFWNDRTKIHVQVVPILWFGEHGSRALTATPTSKTQRSSSPPNLPSTSLLKSQTLSPLTPHPPPTTDLVFIIIFLLGMSFKWNDTVSNLWKLASFTLFLWDPSK